MIRIFTKSMMYKKNANFELIKSCPYELDLSILGIPKDFLDVIMGHLARDVLWRIENTKRTQENPL